MSFRPSFKGHFPLLLLLLVVNIVVNFYCNLIIAINECQRLF